MRAKNTAVILSGILLCSVFSMAGNAGGARTPGMRGAAEEDAPDDSGVLPANILPLLMEQGAVTYAQKNPYEAGVDRIVLGYAEDESPVIGVAVRETRTYTSVSTLIAVIPDEAEGYLISFAEILDPENLPGLSRTLSLTAVEDIEGRTVESSESALRLVDAVSGATKYYQTIYISYGLMASRIISEMENDSGWERFRLTPE